VRTVIAPLGREVEAQLATLDPRLAGIARRFIRRLALEPQLGHPVSRGLLGSVEARAIYLDRQSRPEDLFGGRRPARRAGDQDLAEGPRWRVVYALLEATRADVRVVVVLAVGRAHTAPGQDDVYLAAERLLRRRYRRRPS
jgi:hypothetical protein